MVFYLLVGLLLGLSICQVKPVGAVSPLQTPQKAKVASTITGGWPYRIFYVMKFSFSEQSGGTGGYVEVNGDSITYFPDCGRCTFFKTSSVVNCIELPTAYTCNGARVISSSTQDKIAQLVFKNQGQFTSKTPSDTFTLEGHEFCSCWFGLGCCSKESVSFQISGSTFE